MSTYDLLKQSEAMLKGKWLLAGSSVVADNTSLRIEYLTSNVLSLVTIDDSGWVSLYRDPQDLRYWELSYPESDEHGGGAPILRCVNDVEIRARWGQL